MDVQDGSGDKDTSGTLSSANPPISVAAPKPLSSNIDSRYVCQNQNTLLFMIKCLPTNFIKVPSTIWRWYQVQGYEFVIIRLGLFIEFMIFMVVGSLLIPEQADQEVLSLDHQKGGSEFLTLI